MRVEAFRVYRDQGGFRVLARRVYLNPQLLTVS